MTLMREPPPFAAAALVLLGTLGVPDAAQQASLFAAVSPPAAQVARAAQGGGTAPEPAGGDTDILARSWVVTEHHLINYTWGLVRRGTTNVFEDRAAAIWTISVGGSAVTLHRELVGGRTIEYSGTLAADRKTASGTFRVSNEPGRVWRWDATIQ